VGTGWCPSSGGLAAAEHCAGVRLEAELALRAVIPQRPSAVGPAASSARSDPAADAFVGGRAALAPQACLFRDFPICSSLFLFFYMF
jgi:hypothetical protein